jgi:hypothetical protein
MVEMANLIKDIFKLPSPNTGLKKYQNSQHNQIKAAILRPEVDARTVGVEVIVVVELEEGEALDAVVDGEVKNAVGGSSVQFPVAATVSNSDWFSGCWVKASADVAKSTSDIPTDST